MILDLLAVGLLSFGLSAKSVSSYDIKQSDNNIITKRNAVQQPTLRGAYVINHWNDDYYFFSDDFFDHDVSLDLNVISYYSGIYCTAIDFAGIGYRDIGSFTHALHVQIDYLASGHVINVSILLDEEYANGQEYVWSIGFEDVYSDISIMNASASANVTAYKSYLGLYFMLNYDIDYEQYVLFNTVFTKDLNSNFKMLNGWYNFNGSISDTRYNLCGLITYNNVYYNYLEYRHYMIRVAYYNGENQSYYQYLYSNYSQDPVYFPNGQRNVLLTNVVAPITTYNQMQNTGVFQYLASDEQYTLTDMFIDIADTPLIFITSMFDFELFGTTFYVALLGIVTVIAIIFIVKKVI